VARVDSRSKLTDLGHSRAGQGALRSTVRCITISFKHTAEAMRRAAAPPCSSLPLDTAYLAHPAGEARCRRISTLSHENRVCSEQHQIRQAPSGLQQALLSAPGGLHCSGHLVPTEKGPEQARCWCFTT
jgi:hypothetical protein